MPTESELRDLLSRPQLSNTIDADAVIKRSRARRLPQQLAAGAIGTLAILGISVVGVQTLRLPDQSAVTGTQQESALAAPEDARAGDSIKRAPAERLNLCEGTLADVVPSRLGLQLDVEFPGAAPAGADVIIGIVRLTNTGSERVTGSTGAAPAVAVSENGIVRWHSNGPTILSLVNVDLAPGESLVYEASIVPVRCSVDDDLAESFSADLPSLVPGVYELSAAVDFSPAVTNTEVDFDGGVDLVTGPRATIVLE
ncbi:MAG: hypothetical protein LH616_10515 [Ilumatobacteraceae bacterium]|nr:hypothetical protein [Ilumatobacteraceae bacterium]